MQLVTYIFGMNLLEINDHLFQDINLFFAEKWNRTPQ